MRTELQNEYFDDSGHVDIESVLKMNIDSTDFNSLPSDVQYELLKDLKEIRKRRRTRIEAMPEESNSFSDYQIAGLLAKRKISKKMEHVENKMSEENLAASSVHAGFTDQMMEDHDIDARQLVSDSSTHFIWMRKSNKKNANKVDEPKTEENKALPSIQEQPILEENEQSNQLQSLSEKEPTIISTPDSKTQESLHEDVKVTVVKDEKPIPDSDMSTSNSSQPDKTPTERILLEEKQSPSQQTELKSNNADLVYEMPNLVEQTSSVPQNLNISVGSDGNIISCENNDLTNTASPGNFKTGAVKETINIKSTNNDAIESNMRQDFKAVHHGDIITNLTDSHSSEIEMPKTSEKTPVSAPFSKVATQETDIEKIADADESSDDDFIDIPEQATEIKTVELSPDKSKISDAGNESVSNETKDITEDLPEESSLIESNPWEGLNADNIEAFTGQLDEESKELKKLMQAKERAARDLSQSAQLECQELLQLFGLPYILSPQEAEAQCAALEMLGLTNGTITEDSDIWLFGGKFVIKDMFGNKRDPVVFNASDIEMQLGLNRDRFICIALCSGSDYTTGIHGVGPVTALEILKEFEGDGIQGLVSLRKWWDESCNSVKQLLPTETKIKSQLRRFHLNKDFPSEAVYKAYTQPIVDDADTKFQWGFPDLDELRSFAINTMGWTRIKADESLLPLMKKLGQRRSAQLKVTQFFTTVNTTASKAKSKRVRRAVASLKGTTEDVDGSSIKKKSRTTKGKKKSIVKEEKLNLSESSSDSN